MFIYIYIYREREKYYNNTNEHNNNNNNLLPRTRAGSGRPRGGSPRRTPRRARRRRPGPEYGISKRGGEGTAKWDAAASNRSNCLELLDRELFIWFQKDNTREKLELRNLSWKSSDWEIWARWGFLEGHTEHPPPPPSDIHRVWVVRKQHGPAYADVYIFRYVTLVWIKLSIWFQESELSNRLRHPFGAGVGVTWAVPVNGSNGFNTFSVHKRGEGTAKWDTAASNRSTCLESLDSKTVCLISLRG